MRRHVVQDHVNRSDRFRNLRLDVFKEGDEFFLPLTVIRLPVDLACTSVEGGKQLECTSSFVFVLDTIRSYVPQYLTPLVLDNPAWKA